MIASVIEAPVPIDCTKCGVTIFAGGRYVLFDQDYATHRACVQCFYLHSTAAALVSESPLSLTDPQHRDHSSITPFERPELGGPVVVAMRHDQDGPELRCQAGDLDLGAVAAAELAAMRLIAPLDEPRAALVAHGPESNEQDHLSERITLFGEGGKPEVAR